MLIQSNETNVDELVENSPLPVLLDLWATWCAPCETFKPVLERAGDNFAERLVIAQVDIDACKALANRLGVRSVPTMILFKEGAEAARTSGAMRYAQLVAWLGKHGIDPPPGDANGNDLEEKDDSTWSAFYGDNELKQFYAERVRRLAESGRIERSRFPRWSVHKGSISAAFNQRADPRLFERTTGMPISAGLAMEFASIASPEATTALFDAIHPGADLSQVASRLVLAWLGDSDHISAAFLGDAATDALRRDWASTLCAALDGASVAPATWASLRQRAQAIRSRLTVEHPMARLAIYMLTSLSPPPDPDASGAWFKILNLHGPYMVFVRPLFDAGFSQRDIALEEIQMSFLRTAAGGRNGTDLSREELVALRDRWETEHAEDHARLGVVHEASRRMRGPEHARIASLLFAIVAQCPVPTGANGAGQ